MLRGTLGTRRELSIFLLFWIVAVPMRFLFLEAKSIHTDEMDILLSASGSLKDLLTWCAEGNWPPLFHLLVKWSLTFKQSDAALRFPAAMAAVLALPATYFALGRLFKAPVPLLVCILLIWSPYQLHYDRTAKMYPLLILLSMLSLLLLHDAIHKGKGWRWFLFSVAQAGSLYASYFALPLFAGLGLYGFLSLAGKEDEERPVSWRPRTLFSQSVNALKRLWKGPRGFRERQLILLSFSFVLVLLFYMPWLQVAVRCLARNIGEEGKIAFSHYAKSSGSLPFFFVWIMAVFGSGGAVILDSPLSPLYWLGGTVWLIPASIGFFQTMKRSVAIPSLITMLVGGPFFLLWALNPTTSSYPRFLMTAMPFLFALSCQALVSFLAWLHRRTRLGARIAAVFLTLWIVFLWAEPHHDMLQGDAVDWKQAAAYLDDHLQEGDLLIGGRYNGAPILIHYLPQWQNRVKLVPYWAYEMWYERYESCRQRGLPSHIERETKGHNAWFVTSAEKDIPECIWKALRTHFVEEAVFPSIVESGKVRVYRWHIKEGILHSMSVPVPSP